MTSSIADEATRAYAELTKWHESQGSATPIPYARGLDAIARFIRAINLPTLVPVLPFILRLKGKPFDLGGYFPLEPMYKRTEVPAKTIMRCGRQVSKCVAAGSRITLPDGSTTAVESLTPGTHVLAIDGEHYVSARRVLNVFDNGLQPVIHVQLSSGRLLRVTANHKLKTVNGFKEARKLSVGDALLRVIGGTDYGDTAISHQALLLLADRFVQGRLNELTVTTRHFNRSTQIRLFSHIRNRLERSRFADGEFVFYMSCPSTAAAEDLQDFASRLGLFTWVDDRQRVSYKHADLRKLGSSEPLLVEDHVVAVLPGVPASTYDLEVEQDHTYVLEGVISHNSTTLAAQGVIRSAVTPYLNTLCVAPLFEQIRRFSNNYVRPFIDESPMRKMLIGAGARTNDNSVFQRTFINGANMFFTFAFLDAERARGIAADILNLDEIQDIDLDHMPVLESCLAASQYGLVQMSGTPKTTDNTIDYFWDQSSQAHWVMQCQEPCGHYNVAMLELGLDRMVTERGLCCEKCGRLLNARAGFYHHMFKERVGRFEGWHVPQPIMPMHYEQPHKWAALYEHKVKWPQFRYYNEVLGESCDVGSRLITRTELMAAAKLPWANEPEAGYEQIGNYQHITMGVDWGGGGGGTVQKRRGQLVVAGGTTSFTVITIVGFKLNSPAPHVLCAIRLKNDMTPEQEVRYIIRLFRRFRCRLLAHDYGGAGFLRETALLQAGLSPISIMPCLYVRSVAKPIVYMQPMGPTDTRRYYSVDKTRSLALLCSILKAGMGLMPKWPPDTDNEPCLYEDFLSLIESRVDTMAGPERYLITRDPKKPDDFCHAFNFACAAEWHSSQLYPNLAKKFGISMGSEDGTDNMDWNAVDA